MQITRLLLVVIILTTTLVSTIGITNASFNDLEESVGNAFQAWTSSLWTQTTQADFEAGVGSEVDTASSPGDVILENWTYRRQITIDHTKVDDVADPSTTYAEFPVLVYAAGLSNINTDGTDIRFTASDGVTELPREIESYSGGTLYAWVKVTLTKDASDSTDDIIYMYYGNASASEPAAGSTYGAENVWNSNFKAVWHLNQATGGTGAILDSTSYDNNGTDQGTPTFETTGQMGYAIDFDGTSDYISVPDDDSLDLATGLTIEAWINVGTWGNWKNIAFKGDNSATNTDYQFALVSTGLAWDGTLGGTWRTKYFNTSQDTGTWIYAVLTHDTTDVKCYRAGSEISSQNDAGAMYVSTEDFGIAAVADGTLLLDGTIDELRVSSTARSANWILTSYKNQDNPSTFCGIGTEEDQGNWYSTSWTRRCPTNITNSTATALSDYQVKLTLSYDSDMQGDFADIRFTDNNGTTLLPYWMQSYVASTSAIFWVKVPSIPSGTKTIYMYYGNPVASSTGDGDATFEFFDDFEEHASGTDPDGWTDQGTENFYVALHDSEKWFQVNTWNDWMRGSTASSMANIGDAVWSAKVYYHQLGTNAWGGIGVHIGNGNIGCYVVIRDGGWYRANEPDWSSASGWQSNTDIHFPLGTKGRIELITNGTNLDAYWYNPSGYSPEKVTLFTGFTIPSGTGKLDVHIERPGGVNNRWVDADDIIVRKYISPEPTAAFGPEESSVYVSLYVSLGTIASQVLDTTMPGAVWNSLFWDETLESNTDIIFEVRAANTLNGGFPDASWIDVGGTSPVTSGLPSGRYIQWQVTLNTSDTSKTPWLHEVRVYYY